MYTLKKKAAPCRKIMKGLSGKVDAIECLRRVSLPRGEALGSSSEKIDQNGPEIVAAEGWLALKDGSISRFSKLTCFFGISPCNYATRRRFFVDVQRPGPTFIQRSRFQWTRLSIAPPCSKCLEILGRLPLCSLEIPSAPAFDELNMSSKLLVKDGRAVQISSDCTFRQESNDIWWHITSDQVGFGLQET